MTSPPSPLPPGAPEEPEALGELTDDAITATFRVWQRKRGHRYSLDDVLTAWEAACVRPHAKRCLELGTGLGSVLHMLAYALPDAHFVAIEAQRNSFRLLERNLERNALHERVRAVHGDFRQVVEPSMHGAPFELVTGTPPYVPPGQATPSSDAQRAYARQEFRGGVEAYIEAAARVLAPTGRVVVCGDARTPERVDAACRERGLAVERHRDAVPRQNAKGPLFSVWTLAWADALQGATPMRSTWYARDAGGARTEAYREVRAFFGLPSPEDEAPSP